MYSKHPYEAKTQLLINKSESVSIKIGNDFKDFIQQESDIDDIYENIDECNRNKKCKVFFVSDDIIAICDIYDWLATKKFNQQTEVFIRRRKISIFLAFITESYFTVPKDTRLNSTPYFSMKIPNK